MRQNLVVALLLYFANWIPPLSGRTFLTTYAIFFAATNLYMLYTFAAIERNYYPDAGFDVLFAGAIQKWLRPEIILTMFAVPLTLSFLLFVVPLLGKVRQANETGDQVFLKSASPSYGVLAIGYTVAFAILSLAVLYTINAAP